jgi:flagellar basal-body rod protein FlgC
METGISPSIAGFTAFGRQMEITARNVANIVTEGYKPPQAKIVQNNQGVPELSFGPPTGPGIPILGPDTPVREPSTIDLSQEMSNLLLARRGYEANLKTFKIQSELDKSVLDLVV